MSSVVHARTRTIDKSCLKEAAEALGATVSENKEGLVVNGVSFAFSGNETTLRFTDDVRSQKTTARQMSQLSSFYTMKNRMEKLGFKMKTATQDAVAAVRAGQKLSLEYEEQLVTA